MPAPEIINIGTSANDGSGDPIRNAFSKINNNFDYVFDALPAAGSNITITNVTISTSTPNSSIIMSPNGTGTFIVNSIANITGNTYISNLSISGEIFSNININGEIYASSGNIITDAGILHLANNKTATQSIDNVFIHFAEANIGGIEYKFGVTSVPLEFGNPANVVVVLGSDVPLTTPNVYTGQTIIGNSATFAGTFINPQVIGSYSQSFSDPDFSIYTPGKGRTFIASNLVLQQRTVSSSVGSSGDLPGMIAVDGSNVYVCTGTYDGSTVIWKYSSLTSF